MKKKFDFSAEMSEVESIKTTPKNEYLEEEKRLLDVNAKELASLNNNVYKLRTEVENLSGSIRECKPIISEEMHKLAVEFGATLLCNFLSQIESKCKEAERRANNRRRSQIILWDSLLLQKEQFRLQHQTHSASFHRVCWVLRFQGHFPCFLNVDQERRTEEYL